MSALLALLQFTTILPLGKPQDFDEFARRSWLYPLAGYVIGCLAAVPVLFIADHDHCGSGCSCPRPPHLRGPSFRRAP